MESGLRTPPVRVRGAPLSSRRITLTTRVSHIIPRSTGLSSIFSGGYTSVLIILGILIAVVLSICICQWVMRKMPQHCDRLRVWYRRRALALPSQNTPTTSPQDLEAFGRKTPPRVTRRVDRAPDVTLQVQIIRRNPVFKSSHGNSGNITGTVGDLVDLPKPKNKINHVSSSIAVTPDLIPTETFTPPPHDQAPSPPLHTSAPTEVSSPPRASSRSSLLPYSPLSSPTESPTSSPTVQPHSYPLPPSFPPPSYYTSSRRGASRSIRTLRSIGTLNSERDITTPLPEYRAASVPPYENSLRDHGVSPGPEIP